MKRFIGLWEVFRGAFAKTFPFSASPLTGLTWAGQPRGGNPAIECDQFGSASLNTAMRECPRWRNPHFTQNAPAKRSLSVLSPGRTPEIPHRILNTCFGFDGDEHCVCAHGFFVAELPGFESGSPVKSRLCMTRICHSPAFFAITKFNNP
jgi:hypothetical protein